MTLLINSVTLLEMTATLLEMMMGLLLVMVDQLLIRWRFAITSGTKDGGDACAPHFTKTLKRKIHLIGVT